MKRQEILFKVMREPDLVVRLIDGLNRPRSSGGFGGCVCHDAFRRITKFEGMLYPGKTYKLTITPHRGGKYKYHDGSIFTTGKKIDGAPLRGVDLPTDRVFRAQFRVEEVIPKAESLYIWRREQEILYLCKDPVANSHDVGICEKEFLKITKYTGSLEPGTCIQVTFTLNKGSRKFLRGRSRITNLRADAKGRSAYMTPTLFNLPEGEWFRGEFRAIEVKP